MVHRDTWRYEDGEHSATPPFSVLGVAAEPYVSPEVRAPPIIATRAVFSMRMSCDAVESESNAQLPRSTLPSFVLESYEEP